MDHSQEAATDLALMPPPPPPPLPPPPTMNPVLQERVVLQKAVWKKLHQQAGRSSVIPSPRHGHRALAYKHLMIVFGGGNEGLFGDLNVFNTRTNEWTQPQVTGNVPPGRASYGAVIDGDRILIYGGMEENYVLTDTLYELNLQKGTWTLLTPSSRSPVERPCARMGHSFTLVKDRVFMFGGLSKVTPETANGQDRTMPIYLNDLHILHVRQNMGHGTWEIPVAFGNVPCPRESHSAVAYVTKDLRHNKIVFYGGMFGNRLGDLFTLDVDTMMWSQIQYEGRSHFPPPRSLHTASLVADRMYVFGGWVSSNLQLENITGPDSLRNLWRCDNSVTVLNLNTMTWEKVMALPSVEEEEGIPGGRAGHSAVVMNNKVYVLSGRNGFTKTVCEGGVPRERQDCHNDLWRLEVQKAGAPTKVRLVKTCPDMLSVAWDHVPGADGYLLQMMRFDLPTPLPMMEVMWGERGLAPVPRSLSKTGIGETMEDSGPVIPPSVAPPASSRMIRPVALKQQPRILQQSDSCLMPPPPPSVVPPSMVLPSVNVSNVQVQASSPQQLPRATATQISGNTTQGSTTVVQRSGGLVRILSHPSAPAKYQQPSNAQSPRMSLTGSLGIPGASSSPATQQQSQQLRTATSPVTQQAGGPIVRLTAPQGQPLRLINSPGQGRTGSHPVRLLMAGQGPTPVQFGTPTRYFTFRLPNGNNIMIPEEIVSVSGPFSSQTATRVIRVPAHLPVPAANDDGGKLVAVEGMLTLAEGQNSQNVVGQVQMQVGVPSDSNPAAVNGGNEGGVNSGT